MARKRKDNSPIEENWIKKRCKKDERQQALELVAKRNKYESEHEFKSIRIDSKTTILKRIS
jgi:hypothetical protein